MKKDKAFCKHGYHFNIHCLQCEAESKHTKKQFSTINVDSPFCKHGVHMAIRCMKCENEKKAEFNRAIPISEHPLKDEIFRKLESGEITIGSPVDPDFVWTDEKIKELDDALKRVRLIENK